MCRADDFGTRFRPYTEVIIGLAHGFDFFELPIEATVILQSFPTLVSRPPRGTLDFGHNSFIADNVEGWITPQRGLTGNSLPNLEVVPAVLEALFSLC